ncbi:unnamed protein product [Ectocarpus sp. 8 AP-2014]
MPPEPELAHPSFSRRASNTSATSSSSRTSSAEKAHAKSLRNAGKENGKWRLLHTLKEKGEKRHVAAVQLKRFPPYFVTAVRCVRVFPGLRTSPDNESSPSRVHRVENILCVVHSAVQQCSCKGCQRQCCALRWVGTYAALSCRGPSAATAEPFRRFCCLIDPSGSILQILFELPVLARRGFFSSRLGSTPSALTPEGRDLSRSFQGSYSADPGDDAAAAEAAVGRPSAAAVEGGGEATSFRNTAETMEDEERETLLALLTGAYGQVNDLTDELKISLDKLNDTEKELKAVNAAHAKLQAMPNPSPTSLNGQSGAHAEGVTPKRSPVSKLLKDVFPNDEGGRSTPAAVRQLQVEVQRLRQRNAQAHSKEEKYKSEIAHLKR